jgi:hypothetical protein
MPLSIENPGPEPMSDIEFRCLRMTGGQADEDKPFAPLTSQALRFVPQLLTIAPRDFEKLTIYIDVPQETAPGRYQAIIGPEDGSFETTLNFEVISATVPV